MKLVDAKRNLKNAIAGDDPITLPSRLLSRIQATDIPKGVEVQVGRARSKVVEIEWEGSLFRQRKFVHGRVEYTWTRKYWYEPIGLQHYLDLVRRSVELRSASQRDVSLTHFDDDGAFIQMGFLIKTKETNVGNAYTRIQAVCKHIHEAADQASDEVGRSIAGIAQRLSGWGKHPLDSLLHAVETANDTDTKGRSLEELVSSLLETVEGFSVISRVRTQTEEIDVEVLNASKDPRLSRESAIVLVECKNWTGKSGKDEIVLFKEKIANRNKRCTLGIFVSWNGYTRTFDKELLRDSKEETLVVALTGKDIRAAVRAKTFTDILAREWQKAVNV